MPLTNNTELKAAVADWINRDDLTTQIIDFISIAEARMVRDLIKTSELKVTTTLTVDANSKALPADFAGLVYMELNGTYPPLDYFPADSIAQRFASGTSGRPISYSIQAQTIYFFPLPDSTYTATYTYIAKPDIATDSTNRILTMYPDVYLFGALAEAASFLEDEATEEKYKAKYQDAINRISNSDMYKGPLTIQLADVP